MVKILNVKENRALKQAEIEILTLKLDYLIL